MRTPSSDTPWVCKGRNRKGKPWVCLQIVLRHRPEVGPTVASHEAMQTSTAMGTVMRWMDDASVPAIVRRTQNPVPSHDEARTPTASLGWGDCTATRPPPSHARAEGLAQRLYSITKAHARSSEIAQWQVSMTVPSNISLSPNRSTKSTTPNTSTCDTREKTPSYEYCTSS